MKVKLLGDMVKKENKSLILTNEQSRMINLAKQGHNILVDACVGSGKTTSIQILCEQMSNKKILYLTYNRLLKIDAQDKIKSPNVTVTNYNSYVNKLLVENDVYVGVDCQLEVYLSKKFNDPNKYDLLIVDEYQDIESDHANLLNIIKERNKGIQIIFVGDLSQKIYDNSRIDIKKFIEGYLKRYKIIKYTKCFRLSKSYANRIGKIWKKEINGVNKDCIIKEWDLDQTIKFLLRRKPSEILCLGTNYSTSDRKKIQNELEENAKTKFNKITVYSKIMDADDGIKINKNDAIFTTFDSCKGMERDICVVCDFTEKYWDSRIEKPMQKYDVLRNIFCVAMSRGKKYIIFVNKTLSDLKLKRKYIMKTKYENGAFHVTNMFDFKYKEDVDKCYKSIRARKIENDDENVRSDNSIIKTKRRDGKIDLSPCVGIFQETYFTKFDIRTQIEYAQLVKNINSQKVYNWRNMNLQNQILYLTSLETGQNRYKKVKNFITESTERKLFKRLGCEFDKKEKVQIRSTINFSHNNSITGIADVLKDNVVWEIKFVSALKKKDFLQCAMYIALLNLKKGRLWNTMNNEMYEITIPNKTKFLDMVVCTITKGAVKKFKTQRRYNIQ